MGRHCAVQPGIGAYGAAERQSGRSDSSPEGRQQRVINAPTFLTAEARTLGQLSDPLDSFRTLWTALGHPLDSLWGNGAHGNLTEATGKPPQPGSELTDALTDAYLTDAKAVLYVVCADNHESGA